MVASMQHLRDDDGLYWTGYVFDDDARWPWSAPPGPRPPDPRRRRPRRQRPAGGRLRADDLPLGVEVGDVCELDALCTRDRR